MPSSGSKTPEKSIYDVAVIGGGLAGISAAMGLAQHGKRVILLESKRRLGGRAGSFLDTATQTEIDYCQHVSMHCCTALRVLIKLLEQTNSWQVQKQLHFVGEPLVKQPNETRFLSTGSSWLPAPFHLSGLLRKWPKLQRRDQTNIAAGMWRLFRTPVARLPTNQTAADWLRSIGQREQSIQRFWQTIIVSALGESIETVGIKATRKVLVDGFAASRSATWLWIPKKPLSQLFGDDAQTQLTRHGVTVKTESRVTEIGFSQDSLQIHTNGRDESNPELARNVVLATHWNQSARLLKSLEQNSSTQTHQSNADDVQLHAIDQIVYKAKQIRSAPITGIHTWWDKNWLTRPNAILVDRFCHWIFGANPSSETSFDGSRTDSTHSNEPAATRDHYLQIVISGSHDLRQMSTEEIRNRILKDINELFPESRTASLLRLKIVTDPQAVFALTASTDDIRPATKDLMNHNIWLAGDWVQSGWPATMEGAVRSGFMAADAIAEAAPYQCVTPPELPREPLASLLIR